MLTILGKVQKEFNISGRNRQDVKREEREEKAQQKRLADMDPLVRQLRQYREDAAQMRESNQMAFVDAKLKSGGELTPEEQEYLKQNNPDAYREYQEIKQEREAYQRQLKSCRTKEDVEELKLNKMGSFMAEAKKIANNPVIPKDKKKGLMEKLLKKAMGIQEEYIAFTKTVNYQHLPTEEELTEKVKEKMKTSETDETAETEKSAENIEFNETGKPPSSAGDHAEETGNGQAEFEDVSREIRKFLTTDRPSGYGLEYFDTDTGSRKDAGKDTIGDF